MKLTKTDAAKHLNISRTTVYNMISRGALAVDDTGLIDVEQLEQVCTPCKGERQGENTNRPVEFRDASPLILGRYVSYLEHELDRVRAEKDQYITSLEKQVEFLQEELKKTREDLADADDEELYRSMRMSRSLMRQAARGIRYMVKKENMSIDEAIHHVVNKEFERFFQKIFTAFEKRGRPLRKSKRRDGPHWYNPEAESLDEV
jgi:hypothetical protein